MFLRDWLGGFYSRGIKHKLWRFWCILEWFEAGLGLDGKHEADVGAGPTTGRLRPFLVRFQATKDAIRID